MQDNPRYSYACKVNNAVPQGPVIYMSVDLQAYLEDMVQRLEADMAIAEPKLQAAREKRDVLAQEAKALQQEAEQIDTEREALFKQNRQSRFHTKVHAQQHSCQCICGAHSNSGVHSCLFQEERDAFLTAEISAAKHAISSHTKAHKAAEAEKEQAARSLSEMEAELAQTSAEKSQAVEQLRAAQQAFKEAEHEHNSLMEECALNTHLANACNVLHGRFRFNIPKRMYH